MQTHGPSVSGSYIMAKHPTSRRVHREDHGPDDAFVSAVKRAYTWVQEHSRAVTIGFVVVAVVVVGFIWYSSQQQQMEAQAAARFNQVQQSLAAGNTELAIRDLQSYLDRFGGTQTADQARLMLASLLIQEEQPADAVDALGGLPKDLDNPFGLAAARLLAATQEEMGQVDEAVRTYERIADQARFSYQRREALADAARVHLHNGQPERAAALYQEILASFDDDEPERGYYTMWLAEARARAEQGTAAPAATPAPPSDTSPDSDADTAG